ncbi:FkbM family methyltransferase [Parabacteroides pacaensis]|uniref:FkbM family methyltransferase n=1 Tax=Parabacteroides pacaensis TaxID=2086575 RepID=UPI00131C7DEA|nr:FkbM family methyltransferase [Parabacteroides pacaensis]
MQLKKLAFRTLSIKNYLRILQEGYFIAYHLGLLKKSPIYVYHYFVKNLIHKGDYVLDIGANLGYYSKLFSNWVGDQGKVFAVEPVKPYNEVFRETTRNRKNIVLYPYALGTEEKEITMIAPFYSGYLNTGLPHVYDPEKDKDNIQALSFKAEMKIPSQLFGNLEKLNYIKCDIEGFEKVVLEDLKEIIARHKPLVQVEIWDEYQPDILELFHSLHYHAYQLYEGKLVRITQLPPLIDGDFIFIPQEDKRFTHLICQ